MKQLIIIGSIVSALFILLYLFFFAFTPSEEEKYCNGLLAKEVMYKKFNIAGSVSEKITQEERALCKKFNIKL